MKHVLPLSLALCLCACGNNDKTTTITTGEGDDIKITQDGDSSAESGTITFEGKDGRGKITYGDGASGQPLPLNLPVYPGGELKGTFTGSGPDGNNGGMATVMAKDAPTEVVDFYKKEATKRGMEIKTQATSSGKMASFSAESKDASLMVTATPGEDGGTTVAIIGGEKN